MSIFTGSAVALITPFTDTGVDFDALDELIDFQIENDTDALVVLGTTGEPATMTAEEKHAVIERAVRRVDGRIPVIAGTGTNATAAAVAASKEARDLGADALLVVTPYYNYNKPNPNGLVRHFLAIADAVDIPIIIYNVPSRTGLNLTPQILCQIAGHPNIRAIKEASCSIAQVGEVHRLVGDRMDIYSGEDSITLPILACGGKGVISVAANIVPRQMRELVAHFLRGDLEKARELQWYLNPLCNALFLEVNPIPVKTAARLMGLPGGQLRLPLADMADDTLAQLKRVLADYGLTGDAKEACACCASS